MIIGLAEINNQENLKDLVELEPFSNNFGIVHYDSLDERGVDTALLYDKRKISVLDSEAISFVFEKHHENPDDLDTTRDVLHCRLNYYNQKIINVFVAHLPSKREKDIINFAQYHHLEFINCACKFTSDVNAQKKDSKRLAVKKLLNELRKKDSNIDYNIFSSSERVLMM